MADNECTDHGAREMAAAAKRRADEAISVIERFIHTNAQEHQDLKRDLTAHRQEMGESVRQISGDIKELSNSVHQRIDSEKENLEGKIEAKATDSLNRDNAISNRFWGLLISLLLLAIVAIGGLLLMVIE